jgi:hypothetical protein
VRRHPPWWVLFLSLGFIPARIQDEILYSPTGRPQRRSKTIASDGITAMTVHFSNSSAAPGEFKPKIPKSPSAT